MIIECPECKARYRARNYTADQPSLRVKCPKCSHVFLFKLPVAATKKTTDQMHTAAVLVVDDARFFREILSELLAPLQVKLVSVGTAVEALEMMSQQSFQLALIDLNLPDMTGQDLMRKIRSDASLKQLKLLAMSGAFRRDDCETDAIRAGADGFINKSFKPEDLQQRVRELLAQ
ncbi:MAG TPA: response regulator [Geopsychrobacteraceae bacterium]|nr:response regulator [Geopsychrobacteraceae bacterium]